MTKPLFITDKNIWKNCERFLPKEFLENNAKNLFLSDPKADDKTLKKISKALEGCDFILALGSGTINDLAKFSAAQKDISYAIFVSAPSMNGYLSRNASITISGHKKTLPATVPEAVFCDLRILKSAPLRMIKAGVGDALCFYSCWFDWYLSYRILGTKFSKKPFNILQEKMDFLIKNFRKFSLRDEEFLKLLIEILLLSGEGMTMAEGSYPASQSEHLIAHTIEMKYPEIAKKKLHGEMIAVTTLTSSALQKNLLNSAELTIPKSDSSQLSKFFGKKIANQCQEEFLNKSSLKPKKVNWSKLKIELEKIHLDESIIKEIFTHFKITSSPRSLGLTKQEYQTCITNAKFIRNRFTCLDIIS